MNPLQKNFEEYIHTTSDLNDQERQALLHSCLQLPNPALKELYITFTMDPDFIAIFYRNLQKKQEYMEKGDAESLQQLSREEEEYCQAQQDKLDGERPDYAITA